MSYFYFRKSNLVFCHNPKAAGRSIRDGLFKDEWVRKQDGPKMVLPNDWPKDRMFGVIREPMDRFASAVRYLKSHSKTKNFLKTNALGKIYDIIIREPVLWTSLQSPMGFILYHAMKQSDRRIGLSNCEKLVKFENINESLNEVLSHFDVEKGDLPHINKTHTEAWEVTIPTEWHTTIRNFYSDDFELYEKYCKM